MTTREALTAERLRYVLDYDPETGIFTWRVQLAGRRKIGSVAGHANKTIGYRIIRIDNQQYYAHRLAGRWPVAEVDHQNLDRGDNRWGNLREADRAQNCANVGLLSTNSSGVKGVYWDAARERWAAEIHSRGVRYMLGRFASFSEAAAARAHAEISLHADFRRAA